MKRIYIYTYTYTHACIRTYMYVLCARCVYFTKTFIRFVA